MNPHDQAGLSTQLITDTQTVAGDGTTKLILRNLDSSAVAVDNVSSVLAAAGDSGDALTLASKKPLPPITIAATGSGVIVISIKD